MSHYDGMREVESTVERLRALICREADVKVLHRLREVEGGRFAYLIETPFMTFPKFAVGTCSAGLADVQILLTCGLRVTAEAEFVSRWGTQAEREALNRAS